MANPFFKLALAAAARLAGNPGRILRLATQSLLALRQLEIRSTHSLLHQRLHEFGRLLTAYARGRYSVLPTKAVVSVTAAVLYFLNPFDLVPDALPALGLTDDFAILTWVYRSLSADLDTFRAWEENSVAPA